MTGRVARDPPARGPFNLESSAPARIGSRPLSLQMQCFRRALRRVLFSALMPRHTLEAPREASYEVTLQWAEIDKRGSFWSVRDLRHTTCDTSPKDTEFSSRAIKESQHRKREARSPQGFLPIPLNPRNVQSEPYESGFTSTQP